MSRGWPVLLKTRTALIIVAVDGGGDVFESSQLSNDIKEESAGLRNRFVSSRSFEGWLVGL